MSTTRSRPPDLDDLDWDEPPSRRPPPRRPRGGGAARKVGLPVVGGALVIGLLVGFLANSGGGGTTTNHGDCVSRVAGSGGAQVSPVAQSDCGKPSTAVGPPADAHSTVPPGQV